MYSLFFSPRSVLQRTARSWPFSTRRRIGAAGSPPVLHPSLGFGSVTVPSSTTSPAKRVWTWARRLVSRASDPESNRLRDRRGIWAVAVVMPSVPTTSAGSRSVSGRSATSSARARFHGLPGSAGMCLPWRRRQGGPNDRGQSRWPHLCDGPYECNHDEQERSDEQSSTVHSLSRGENPGGRLANSPGAWLYQCPVSRLASQPGREFVLWRGPSPPRPPRMRFELITRRNMGIGEKGIRRTLPRGMHRARRSPLMPLHAPRSRRTVTSWPRW